MTKAVTEETVLQEMREEDVRIVRVLDIRGFGTGGAARWREWGELFEELMPHPDVRLDKSVSEHPAFAKFRDEVRMKDSEWSIDAYDLVELFIEEEFPKIEGFIAEVATPVRTYHEEEAGSWSSSWSTVYQGFVFGKTIHQTRLAALKWAEIPRALDKARDQET